MFKIFIFAPDDKTVVEKIIQVASDAGAGKIGNYTQCAFITRGTGHWKSESGANPTVGEVGKISNEPEVRIEMLVPESKLNFVIKAVQNAHPYETPEIDIVKIVDKDSSGFR